MADLPEVGLKAIVEGIDKYLKDLESVADGYDEIAGETAEVTATSGKASAALDKVGGVAAGIATGGLALLATAVVGIAAGIVGMTTAGAKWASEFGEDMALVQAQTGATDEELAKFKETAEAVYKLGLGETFEDVAQAMATTERITGAEGEALETLTRDGLTLAEVFDKDINETMRATNKMMDQLGVEGGEAIDLITVALQETGDPADDLLDTINEYAANFEDAGYTGKTMMNTLVAGLEAGAWNFDKVGDAVREFNIRLTDGSETSSEALQALTGDSEGFLDELSKGTITGADAMGILNTKLRGVEDPLERNRLGVALYGSMWEDMGADTILSLDTTVDALERTEGATEQARKVVKTGLRPAWEGLKRTLKVSMAEGFEPVLTTLVEKLTPAFETFATWLEGPGQEVLESFGTFIAETLGPALEKLGPFLEETVLPALVRFGDWFTEKGIPAMKDLGEWVEDKLMPALAEIWDWVKVNGPKIWRIVKLVSERIGEIIETVSLIIEEFVEIVDTIKETWEDALEAVEDFKEDFKEAVQAIMDAMIEAIEDAADKVKTAFANTVGKAVTWLKTDVASGDLAERLKTIGSSLLDRLSEGIESVTTLGGDLIKIVVKAVTTLFQSAYNLGGAIRTSLETVGKKLIDNIIAGVGKTTEGEESLASRLIVVVTDAIISFAAWVSSKYFGIGKRIYEAGKDIIGGIVEGLKAAASKVWETLKKIIEDAVGNVFDFFGVEYSPSTLFMEVGKDIMRGLELGLASQVPVVAAQLQAAISAPAAVVAPAMGAMNTVTNYYNNYDMGGNTFAGTMGEAEFDARVERAIRHGLAR